jgi:hypothetical protein
MMVYAGLLLATSAGALGLTLLARMCAASAALRRLGETTNCRHRVLDLLVRRLDDWVDEELLSDAGARGFAAYTVRIREPHDTCVTASDLLRAIVTVAGAESSSDQLNLVKYLYQLQNALGLSCTDLDDCIQEVASRLQSTSHHGSPVAHVQTIRPGESVDPKFMWPMNPGVKVVQPLGVAVYDASGKILSKAKVICG